MATAGNKIFKFLTGLNPDLELPENISVIAPYREPEVKKVLKSFCAAFYNETTTRYLIFGINPGRFGAGVTGVPFTDPIALENQCRIPNSFQKKHELSSRFIYEMIEAYGGIQKFYNRFILSAVCPLGFLKGPTNYNYYDSPQLLTAADKMIRQSLQEHARWNTDVTTVISLGKKNASYLEAFNREEKLFENIITLEHPRYIMQYKLKSKNVYIDRYCEVLNSL